MVAYIIRRVLILIPIVLGLSLLVFYIMSLSPADPALIILGDNADPLARAKIRNELGLNRGFFEQYFDYMSNALRGDLGKTYVGGYAVWDQIIARFPNTLKLVFLAYLIGILVGVPIGIYSAIKRYTIIDFSTLVLAMIYSSTPVFFMGLVLLIVFSVKLRWFPSMGTSSWVSFVLPGIALSSNQMAVNIRMTRSSMLEVIKSDYIRTARVKGASTGRVILKHALPNALLPIITVIGMNFAVSMAGAVVAETVFTIRGVGSLLVNSVKSSETPIVMGFVLLFSILVGLINLFIDILYGFIDPRVKTQITSEKGTIKRFIQKYWLKRPAVGKE